MFVLVNLKTYPCDPIAVAEAVRDVDETTDARLAVAPQATHPRAGCTNGRGDVGPARRFDRTREQHRAIARRERRRRGRFGTLLNHSERRLKLADIDGAVRAAERANLETIVCANNPAQIGAAAAVGPDAVAVEPPALIGTGTPVSQADPDVVEDAVDAAANVDSEVSVLCGAGISTGDDVVAAGDLGAGASSSQAASRRPTIRKRLWRTSSRRSELTRERRPIDERTSPTDFSPRPS